MNSDSPVVVKLLPFHFSSKNGFGQFLLHVDTGNIEFYSKSDYSTSERGAVGYGQFKNIGLLGSQMKVFTAIYAFQNRLLVRVGREVFNFDQMSLHAITDINFPVLFARRFRIMADGKSSVDFKYWHFNIDSWPDDADLLSFVADATSNQEKRKFLRTEWTIPKQED